MSADFAILFMGWFALGGGILLFCRDFWWWD